MRMTTTTMMIMMMIMMEHFVYLFFSEKGEKCGVCETVIQYLDSVLQQNATEKEIEQTLEGICTLLPDTIKETVSCEPF